MTVGDILILAAIAAHWLSCRHDMRKLIDEVRQHTGDPALRDRDIEFEEVLARVKSVFNEPVGPREALEAHRGSTS